MLRPIKASCSKAWRKIRRKAADVHMHQTTPTSSVVSESISRNGNLPSRIPLAVPDVEPEPHEPAAQPFPAQTTPDATDPSFPGRLWTDAYDGIKRVEPELVTAYEEILYSELRDEADQADVEPAQMQMIRLVETALKKTEKEAAATNKIQEGIRIGSSITEVVGTALKHAPETAAAWGGVCLLLQVFENTLEEASAHRDGMAYVLSRMDWYWNLSDLLLEKNQERAAGLRSELEKHIVSLYQELLSYQIRSVCSCYRKRAAVLLRNVIKFDDWAGAIQSIKDVEVVVQQDINTYSTQGMKMTLGDIAKQANSQCESLRLIYHGVQQWRRDDKIQKCLADLRLTDPRDDKKRIQDTKGGLLKDSYKWILNHTDFQQWRNNSDSRLLWIKGDPGKGKTMLLCGIIDELEITADTSHLLAHFFCQATDNRLNKPTDVLRGLIYLLVCKQPSLVSHIQSRYEHAGKALFEDANAWVALSDILTNILQDPRLPDTILIIDALDECEKDLPQLLDLIMNIPPKSHLKWLVSSRNRTDIEQKLRSDQSRTRLSLELKSNAAYVSHAVDAYIDHCISEIPAIDGNIERQAQIRNQMRQKADGTFLWVGLVAQKLKDALSFEVLKIVNEVPAGLKELYSHMMEQMKRRKDYLEYCLQVLSTVVIAYRPLRLEKLRALSGLPQSDFNTVQTVEEIVKLCGSFLTIGSGYVSIIHQSAQDFLYDNATDNVFRSGIKAAHHDMFSRSIDILSHTLKRNLYQLDDWGISTDQIISPNPDPLAAVRYSCTTRLTTWSNASLKSSYSPANSKLAGSTNFYENITSIGSKR